MTPTQQYGYVAQPQVQGQAEYRPSSAETNGALPLPSMRSLDPLQQQTQQLQNQVQGQPLPPVGAPAGMPMPMPMPMPQMPYYHGAPMPHPGYGMQDPQMRYALPPTDHRVMSGGRHKKVRLQQAFEGIVQLNETDDCEGD